MIAPATEADLGEAIRAARGPLRIRGGGTRDIGHPRAGEVLSTARFTGIRLYEPGALTIVAGAGTPLAEVEAALAAEGQRLPFEPMDHRQLLGTSGTPTIGGVVAANVSGPRRVQAGACRDFLIGVRFVDGTGTALKSGGRVMKNVTGYDLVKLLAGSWGTLGVLTEVAFKVLPEPEAAAMLTLEGLGDNVAIAAMASALGSPFEITGAAHARGGRTCLRIEGFSASVAYRAGRLSDLLARFGPVTVSHGKDEVAAEWSAIRDVVDLAGMPGDVWRVSLKATDAPALVEALSPIAARYDWGGGLVWLLVAECTDLRASAGPFAGHATLVRASPETRSRIAPFHPEPPAVAALTRGLRERFDPRGLLNSAPG